MILYIILYIILYKILYIIFYIILYKILYIILYKILYIRPCKLNNRFLVQVNEQNQARHKAFYLYFLIETYWSSQFQYKTEQYKDSQTSHRVQTGC